MRTTKAHVFYLYAATEWRLLLFFSWILTLSPSPPLLLLSPEQSAAADSVIGYSLYIYLTHPRLSVYTFLPSHLKGCVQSDDADDDEDVMANSSMSRNKFSYLAAGTLDSQGNHYWTYFSRRSGREDDQLSS